MGTPEAVDRLEGGTTGDRSEDRSRRLTPLRDDRATWTLVDGVPETLAVYRSAGGEMVLVGDFSGVAAWAPSSPSPAVREVRVSRVGGQDIRADLKDGRRIVGVSARLRGPRPGRVVIGHSASAPADLARYLPADPALREAHAEQVGALPSALRRRLRPSVIGNWQRSRRALRGALGAAPGTPEEPTGWLEPGESAVDASWTGGRAAWGQFAKKGITDAIEAEFVAAEGRWTTMCGAATRITIRRTGETVVRLIRCGHCEPCIASDTAGQRLRMRPVVSAWLADGGWPLIFTSTLLRNGDGPAMSCWRLGDLLDRLWPRWARRWGARPHRLVAMEWQGVDGPAGGRYGHAACLLRADRLLAAILTESGQPTLAALLDRWRSLREPGADPLQTLAPRVWKDLDEAIRGGPQRPTGLGSWRLQVALTPDGALEEVVKCKQAVGLPPHVSRWRPSKGLYDVAGAKEQDSARDDLFRGVEALLGDGPARGLGPAASALVDSVLVRRESLANADRARQRARQAQQVLQACLADPSTTSDTLQLLSEEATAAQADADLADQRATSAHVTAERAARQADVSAVLQSANATDRSIALLRAAESRLRVGQEAAKSRTRRADESVSAAVAARRAADRIDSESRADARRARAETRRCARRAGIARRALLRAEAAKRPEPPRVANLRAKSREAELLAGEAADRARDFEGRAEAAGGALRIAITAVQAARDAAASARIPPASTQARARWIPRRLRTQLGRRGLTEALAVLVLRLALQGEAAARPRPAPVPPDLALAQQRRADLAALSAESGVSLATGDIPPLDVGWARSRDELTVAGGLGTALRFLASADASVRITAASPGWGAQTQGPPPPPLLPGLRPRQTDEPPLVWARRVAAALNARLRDQTLEREQQKDAA